VQVVITGKIKLIYYTLSLREALYGIDDVAVVGEVVAGQPGKIFIY
jgi:hypothetical protein